MSVKVPPISTPALNVRTENPSPAPREREGPTPKAWEGESRDHSLHHLPYPHPPRCARHPLPRGISWAGEGLTPPLVCRPYCRPEPRPTSAVLASAGAE